jgi:hypothetical protein
MDTAGVLQILTGVVVAVMMVRYWRLLLTLVVIVLLSLMVIGFLTVIAYWPTG